MLEICSKLVPELNYSFGKGERQGQLNNVIGYFRNDFVAQDVYGATSMSVV